MRIPHRSSLPHRNRAFRQVHSRALNEPLRGICSPAPTSNGKDRDIVDIPRARRWFDLLRWGVQEDLYTYQQPLSGRSGARVCVNGRPMLMLSSYDYLGLIGHPAIEAASVQAIETHGTGTGGVRLLTGTCELHRVLERTIAHFKGTPAALTFSSGYFANLAAITALFGPEDTVFADALAHRSIVDACRLARVPMHRFRHNEPDALERCMARHPRGGRSLIVLEGIYSMEGDISTLPAFVEIKHRYDAFLMVDEAHSVGVLGTHGRGIDEHFGLRPDAVDVWTGSLSKALAGNGGYVAGSEELMVYLQHEAAPFVFSAALCPAAAAAAQSAIEILHGEPERLQRMMNNGNKLRQGLRDLGYDIGNSPTPLIPLRVGGEAAAYRLARRLWGLGVMATAVVYPAVPRGEARLRLCVSAAHRPSDLTDALRAFAIAKPEQDNARAISIA